jgi:DNA-binding GntR family transcriptional regulator
VQANLAEDLGVSTTPVREAMRDLATEGLLQMDPHRGAIVKQLSYAEIREIQDLSQLLEPEAMRRVASVISDRALDQAEALAVQMESEQDMGRWADLNRRFHAALISDLEGTRLARIMKGLRDSAAPYIGLALQEPDSQLDDANRDHRMLLKVLSERDGEQAAQLAVKHAALTIKVLERSRALFEGTR